MSTSADQQLHELYMAAAAEFARLDQPLEAADAYALAAYYARRLANTELERHCRQLVASHNPEHLGAKEKPEPLFYAQLLIRHPADEVQRSLESARILRHAGDASHTPGENTAVAVLQPAAPPAAPHVASVPMRPEVRPPEAAPRIAGKPAYPATPVFETHHVYDLGTAAAQDRLQSLRVTEDLLAQEAQQNATGALDFEDSPAALNLAGSIAAFVGFAAIGFFLYELQPVFARLRLRETIQTITTGHGPAEETAHSDSAKRDSLPLHLSLKPGGSQAPRSSPR